MAKNVTMLETEVKGLYLCTSFHFKEKDQDKEYLTPIVTFLVKSEDGNVIVELDPNGGPITRIEKCDKDYVTKENEHINIKPHWLLGWCKGYGNWTQLAVYDRGLPGAIEQGNFEYLKSVLDEYL